AAHRGDQRPHPRPARHRAAGERGARPRARRPARDDHVPLFIEVKVASAAKAVTELLRALPSGSPAAASTVISFHADALAEIRRGAEVPVSSLVEQVDEQAIAVARELGAAGIGPSIYRLSLRAAHAVRVPGMAVNHLTVHTVAQLEVDLACGADTIITDDPAWVQRELHVRLG